MSATTNSPSEREFFFRFGPWAVVTGASDGIGQAFSEELARRGINLVLVARRETLLAQQALRYSTEFGIACQVVAADLASPAAVKTLLNETEQLDVGLVVAAAGFGTSGWFAEASLEQELEMIDVNCRAVAWLVHAYGQRLRNRKSGGLVLMSSLLAFQGVPKAANYAATKAYIQSLAEGLHPEYSRDGVAIVACAPGPVKSGFSKRADMHMSFAQSASATVTATLAAIGRRGTVRPGALSKLLGWSLTPLPRALRSRILAHIMHGMTRHQGLD